MRLGKREITRKTEIEDVLKQAKVCRLAISDKNAPYIVPMNFGYRDGVLYFHSAGEGRKIDLIRRHPKVCFEVDELIRLKKTKQACGWGAEYKSVIGEGTIRFLVSKEEKKKGLDIIMAHYSDRSFDYPDETLDQTAVLALVIDRMTGKQA